MDPFFFTPRQLATHLLLTYPADYKVSPIQLKNSIIIGNDISGKVFLSAIQKSNDLETMLGVETLGARLWLWDEIIEMRKTSKGYTVWQNGGGCTEKKQEVDLRRLALTSRWEAARKRLQDDVDQSFQNFILNSTPESSASSSPSCSGVFARRLGEKDMTFVPQSATTTESVCREDFGNSPLSICLFKAANKTPETSVVFSRDPSSDFSPSSSQTTSPATSQTTSRTTFPTASRTIFPTASRTTPRTIPQRTSQKISRAASRTTQTIRTLRPRLPSLLPKSKLIDIFDLDNLEESEAKAMLRAIHGIAEIDMYDEFIRAAKITAKERRLQPSVLATKEDRKTVRLVREMAAIYSSWILSKPYPLKSLDKKDLTRIADFELFLQFRVQFLNALIPYDTREL